MFGFLTPRTLRTARLALAAGAAFVCGPLAAQTIPGSVAPAPGFSTADPAKAAPIRVISPKPAAPKPAAAAPSPVPAAAPVVAQPAPASAANPPSLYAPPPSAAPLDANAGAGAGAPVGMSGEAAPAAHPPAPKKRRKAIAPPAPRETELSDSPEPSYTPDTFYATAKESERYNAIAEAGGWPSVKALSPGAKGKAVEALRRRLAIEGDLPADQEAGDVYDAAVKEAVRRFQDRNGLKRNGVVAGATLKAMNVSAAQRFRQLVSSAQRLAGYMFAFGDRYVAVNIPSASVEAIEGGRVVHRYVAVVGGVDHPSPEVTAKIGAVNLNPTWTVPTSIIKNEIIPKMQKDPGYLSRANIRILDGQGREVNPRTINWSSERAVNYTLRQDSGRSNSLGQIRIAMPNKDAVYMHDTPSKGFFGRDYRFLSHGCVRVQGVYDLAAWLLEGSRGGWDKKQILQKIAGGDREDVKLAQIVPVAWVYLTGWTTRDGVTHFRPDVYGLDSIGAGEAARPLAQR